MNRIICLMGPTGSGKTELAIKLVKRHPLAIISVDSAMVYRGLNIGSAKPTAAEQKIAPHRLIDICDPAQRYSAAKFCKDVNRAIENIIAAKKAPLLVGGTMLYFKALLHGLSKLPAADPEIRKKILSEVEKNGVESLYQKLQNIDPESAVRIKPQDLQRIQRALEVYELTGTPMSVLQVQNKAQQTPYTAINIALIPFDRVKLQQKLAARFKKMLTQGLISEVEKLYKRGDLTPDLPAMRSVGYRQVWQYLAGELGYDEMVEKAIIATRQLAKRQLTWLRSWPNLHKFDPDDPNLFTRVYELINEM